jgi:5-methyltetrahydrofolate--homocysteine methyltransferase
MPKISDLRRLVSDLQQKEAEAMTKELLSQGVDPLEILEEGVVKGLTDLGDRFAAKKAIVLDLVKGGITAKACIPHIQAAFPKDKEVPKEKKIVLGTMLSQHNIGKNLVGTLLSIGGFEVIDIGEKTEPWDFYEKAEETGADMIAVSVVFSPAKQKFAELIDLLTQMKVRDKYKVIVGGAVTSERWAQSEGADGWGAQAKDGVDLAKRLLGIS